MTVYFVNAYDRSNGRPVEDLCAEYTAAEYGSSAAAKAAAIKDFDRFAASAGGADGWDWKLLAA